MGTHPVTMVANSVHRLDQSIGLGLFKIQILYEMTGRSDMLVAHLTSRLKRNILS